MIQNSENIEQKFLKGQSVSIEEEKPGNITANQLIQTVNESSSATLELSKREISLFSQRSDRVESQLKQLITQQEFTNLTDIQNTANFNLNQYVNASLMKIINNFYMSEMLQLIDIEDYIDPQTRELATTPNGTPVINFVQRILPLKIDIAVTEILKEMKGNEILFEIKLTDFLRTLLEKVEQECSKFMFNADIALFKQMFFNEKCLTTLKSDEIQLIQNETLMQHLKASKKSEYVDINEVSRQKILESVIMKYEMKDKNDNPFFTEVEEPPIQNKITRDLIEQQLEYFKES